MIYTKLSKRFSPDIPSSERIAHFEVDNPETFTYHPSILTINQSTPHYDSPALTKKITRTQADIYIAVLENATILPNGFVLDKNNHLVLESIYPWAPKNVDTSHAKWIDQIKANQISGESLYIERCIHLRSPAEPGFFHWIQSTLPRLLLAKDRLASDIPLALGAQSLFCSETLQLLDIKTPILDSTKIIKVGLLFFPCPMQFEGDHFHRPQFANIALQEMAKTLDSNKTNQIIYISRNDAKIRRLKEEDALIELIAKMGGCTHELTGMPFQDQIKLFKSAKVVISPHGAGLVNSTFMNAEATLLEILSPQRLWPTFKCIANRLNLPYYGLIGKSIDESQTERRGVGNEDFSIDFHSAQKFIEAVCEKTLG